MKPCFIKVNCLDETEDGLATINANNISPLRRLNYNDIVQTIVVMMYSSYHTTSVLSLFPFSPISRCSAEPAPLNGGDLKLKIKASL